MRKKMKTAKFLIVGKDTVLVCYTALSRHITVSSACVMDIRSLKREQRVMLVLSTPPSLLGSRYCCMQQLEHHARLGIIYVDEFR